MTNHRHSHDAFAGPHPDTIRRVAAALFVTLAFVAIEAAAGVIGSSLALISDAAHNLTDVVALGLSWYAMRLAARTADASKTYGYHRAGILVALLNSTTLVVIALGIFYESYRRFVAPPIVRADILIGVGLVALLVNIGTALLVRRGSERDLNMRSAFVHLMGDVLSTVGAVIAGVLILFTGMNWLDPLASALIGVLIVWNAWGILKETVSILLESTPADVDTAALVSRLITVDGVNGVHDLHVWSITHGMRALSAHILTDDMSISDGARIQREITEILYHDFDIGHATVQLECTGCESVVLYCDIADSTVRDQQRHAPAAERRV